MAYKNTQSRSGTPWRKDHNPEKPASKTSDPLTWAGMADRDPAGNKITTNYPVKQESNRKRGGTGGAEIKAQTLRGYVRNEKGARPSVQNANDMAKGLRGGSTINKISGPGS